MGILALSADQVDYMHGRASTSGYCNRNRHVHVQRATGGRRLGCRPFIRLACTYADRCGITLAEALDTPWAEVRARMWQPPALDTPSQPSGHPLVTPTLLAAIEAKRGQ